PVAMSRRRTGAWVFLSAWLIAAPLYAQAGDRPADARPGATELDRLRDAGVREAAGDVAGAEAVVRAVLKDNPRSLSALIGLERILVAQGRHDELLPAVDRVIAANPTSTTAHQARLRVYARRDDEAGIVEAASAWIAATPHLETPYREVAALWRQRGRPDHAIAILETGRARVEGEDALALELGDAFAAAGDLQRAAEEWARAVSPEGRGLLPVQRRLANQPDGGAAVMPRLLATLGASSSARQRAAVLLALDAGLEAHAVDMTETLIHGLPTTQRRTALVEFARRADGNGSHRYAAWAYGLLLQGETDAGSALAIRTRVAESAMLAGDTALAMETYRQLEAEAVAGSPRQRQALAARLRIAARDDDVEAAVRGFEAFRADHPRAPELDDAAAAVAARLMDEGSEARAAELLAGVAGPRSAALRARLHIRAGDLGRGRDELLTAAAGLRGREATETLALGALLMRLSPAGAEIVAGMIGGSGIDRESALRDALTATARLRDPERAAVLDFAAAAADRSGLDTHADALREAIVADLPATAEAPAALLALARRALERRDSEEAAGLMLERIVVDYPRSVLAPQARQELQRLRSGMPGR
ncbi:MAG TPA: hypothetical protein VK936_04815, partial [Longimicrobiales bacterium]|nr:hypothetical protein [Longimicrobiales bacterium]